MKRWIAILLTIGLAATVLNASTQLSPDEQRSLRTRIEDRFEVVPLGEGVGLRPRSPMRDVRLIEVSDGIVAINGNPVSGRELRERLGSDADLILRISYLDADTRRALVARPGDTERQERPAVEADSSRAAPERPSRRVRARGDRVRVFGNVTVPEDEEISGQVVAVLGSVRIDGEVRDQVVAVLGSVTLGPKAVVRGDIVSVGGHVRRAEGARTEGAVTEVALTDPGLNINVSPWLDGWGPVRLFGWFSPLPRLIGSVFHFLLFALLGSIAFVVARTVVEGSAQRTADDPIKSTLVGLLAELLFVPVMILTTIVLAISIVGIPLLLLLPFAVLALMVLALVGFSGTACAIGRWARRRLGLGGQPGFVDVSLGVLVILLPLLVGRVIALAGWPVTPFAYLLIGAGFAVEVLAWACGFGAVLTNMFARWQARRASRAPVLTPPPATSL